jgi:glutamine amidotransferase
VHSYYAKLQPASLSAASVHYGIEFCCAVAKDNLVATQFHPEKSGDLGLKIYRNFLEFAQNLKPA